MLNSPADNSQADARSAKTRLFGADESDGLRKRVAKARFLQALADQAEQVDLSQGTETSDQREGVTQPRSADSAIDPVRIGRFTVLRKLGQGGMGVVYAAYDEELDRRVALKLIRSDLLGDERGRARMTREAQALARLSHPNVVQVHEISHWDEHDVVTMEFVAGLTFDHWLYTRKRSWSEILDVMVQAGRGLEAAHAAGLVHRDFKPSNLIVGDDSRVRVLDFGLARAATDSDSDPHMHVVNVMETGGDRVRDRHTELPESGTSDDVGADEGDEGEDGDQLEEMRRETELGSRPFDKMLTATGALLGTPAYMSPEQHLGQRATSQSDQFSFCLVLYEALFGERPYPAKTRDEYAQRVVEGAYILPPAGSGVPVWLRDAVCRGLQAAASNRWPSMTELLAELTRDRRRRWTRIATAASLVGVFAVGLAVSSGQQPELCEFDRDTIGDWDQATRDRVHDAFVRSGHAAADARFAQVAHSLDAYVDELVAGRTDACTQHHIARRETDAQLRVREACLDQRQRELRVVIAELEFADASVVERATQVLASVGDVGLCAHPELLEHGAPAPKDSTAVAAIADVREDIARAHAAREAGRMQAAEQFAADARAQTEALDYTPLRSEVAYLFGANAFARLDYDTAESELLAAAQLAEHGHQTELQARIALMEARLAIQQQQVPNYEIAIAGSKLEQLGSPIDMQVELVVAQACTLRDTGSLERALQSFDQAVELAEREFMGSDHLLARVLVLRSSLLSDQGRQDDARADLERALALGLDPNDVNALNCLFNLGVVELEDQNYPRAKQLIERALDGFERVYGTKHPFVGHAQLALSQIAMANEDSAEAERRIGRALEVLDEGHPDHSWALDAAAELHLRLGREDEAVDELSRAVDLAEHAGATELAYLRARLGHALTEAGRYDQAMAPLQSSITALESTTPSIDIVEPLKDRARVLRATGQPERALESLERALDLITEASGRPALAAQVHIELALTLEQLDQLERAREAARAAAEQLSGIPEKSWLLQPIEHLLSN